MGREYQINRATHMVTDHRSVANFLRAGNPVNGYHIIADGQSPLVILNQYRGYDTTVVFFHAAIEQHYTLPVITGLGISVDTPVNRVFISDPSLVLDPELNLAWFAGSQHQRLQGVIEDVVAKFHGRDSSDRLVFFGASGGGFASLNYSAKFPGSIAIASNPQTNIMRYNQDAVSKYASVCFPGAGFPHSLITDLTDIYSKPTENKVLYIQNRGDTEHIVNHFEPYIRVLHPHNDVRVLLGDWGAGHVAPHKEVFTSVLRATASKTMDADLVDLGFENTKPRTSRAELIGKALAE